MEGDTEDSTEQGSKSGLRDMEFIGEKVWKKNRRKGVQKNKLFDTACEKNINTAAEKPVSSENRYISRWYYCCRYVDGGWSIPSSFQKIIKQLEVIQEVLQKHLRQLT